MAVFKADFGLLSTVVSQKCILDDSDVIPVKLTLVYNPLTQMGLWCLKNTRSNKYANISKSVDFYSYFYYIFEIYDEFRIFWA